MGCFRRDALHVVEARGPVLLVEEDVAQVGIAVNQHQQQLEDQ